MSTLHKHIDPEPDRRYIIQKADGFKDSAVVIEATDRHVRLKWDGSSTTSWHEFEAFQPMPDGTTYQRLRILEQLETPRPVQGRHTMC